MSTSNSPKGEIVQARLRRQVPRWKRVQRAMLLTLLSTVVTYLGTIVLAGAWVRQDLAALERSIRGKGEPVSLKDLDTCYIAVPDAENAALAYMKAGEVLATFYDEHGLDLEGPQLESDLKSSDYSYETLTRLNEYLTDRKPVFDALNEALKSETARYPVDLSVLPWNTNASTKVLHRICVLLWLKGVGAIHAGDWDTLVRTEQSFVHLYGTLVQAPGSVFQLQSHICYGKTYDLVFRSIRTQHAPSSLYRTLDPLLAKIDWRRSMKMENLAERVLFASRIDAFYRNVPTAFRADDIKLFRKYQSFRAIPGFQTWGLIEKRNGMRFFTELLDDGNKPWPVVFARTVDRNSLPEPFGFLEPLAEHMDPVDLEYYEPNDFSIFWIDSEAIIRLIRIAVRVDAYRADRGAYPISLDELEWTIPPEIATGPYFDKPFSYRKTENGFVLFDDSIAPENYYGLYARQCEIEFARETPPLPLKAAAPKSATGDSPTGLPRFPHISGTP